MILSDGNIYCKIFSQRSDDQISDKNPDKNKKFTQIKNPDAVSHWKMGIIGHEY